MAQSKVFGKDTEWINVWGARVHNLKNVDVKIPRHSLTVITGLSGSGKSSLAFDTIYAEGQRRYIETFSAYARNFLGNMQRPDVDKISGLSPVISIEQKTTNKNPRSTVGTTTEIYDYLRLLFARAATAYSYLSGEKMVKYTEEKVIDMILTDYVGHAIYILAPLVRQRKGHYRELFESMRKKGYLYIRVDGEVKEITRGMKVDRYKNHNIEVVVDKLKVQGKDDERLKNLGGGNYWKELLDRIRDIRSSEKVMYRQVLDLYATSVDYTPNSPETVRFFKIVQNKLHYAAHGHTAAEVVYQRADADKPFMGLTSFKGDHPTLQEAGIAKNYLTEEELKVLNNLVSGYFDFAEIQAIRHVPMYMKDYIEQLDKILSSMSERKLVGSGSVTHTQAMEKAREEYKKYRIKTLSPVEEDYLKTIKSLEKEAKKKAK